MVELKAIDHPETRRIILDASKNHREHIKLEHIDSYIRLDGRVLSFDVYHQKVILFNDASEYANYVIELDKEIYGI